MSVRSALSSRSSLQVLTPTGYMDDPQPHSLWNSQDPRASSTQSLVPSVDDVAADSRRTLLVVYIHGFMGNDSSFRSFPAHVHSFLRLSLAETHLVHSKIYPRYKTYQVIDVARDNFSEWLEPHESDTTDVILIGHSMGGLLSAEVVLMPQDDPQQGHPFKHRILGTISLDSPFLGLHPGIIVSGIASLFRKSSDPPPGVSEASQSMDGLSLNASTSGSLSPDPSLYNEMAPLSGITSPAANSVMSPSIASSHTSDPYYNPPFFNDVTFSDRGWMKNIAHFAMKHQPEGLVSAARKHIVNHLEFGACLADYVALNRRYNRLRRLEDVDDVNTAVGDSQARVRFVNYYTLSTGRLKRKSRDPSPERTSTGTHLDPSTVASTLPSLEQNAADGVVGSRASTPRIAIEDLSHDARVEGKDVSTGEPHPPPYTQVDPLLAGGSTVEAAGAESSTTPGSLLEESATTSNTNEEQPDPLATTDSRPTLNTTSSLPPIPDALEAPQLPDLNSITDKDERKQAEKEAKRVQKAYDKAVKDREKAIKERAKVVEKQEKRAEKEREKLAREEQKRRDKEEKAKQKAQREAPLTSEHQSRGETPSDQHDPDTHVAGQATKAEKKPKERKFCTLPGKRNGATDETWVPIYMADTDEVGAHCGLFFPGPQYDRLIGDVGSRIVAWVQEDASRRAILALD